MLGDLEDGQDVEDEVSDDWLAAGKRRFLSGPLEFGHAMLITPACAMSAQGASGYAHPTRTLVAVRLLEDIVERGILKAGQAHDLRHRDRFANYMYLPATADAELPESVALLYYPVTTHHDFLEATASHSSPPVGTIPSASDVTDSPNHNSKPPSSSLE